MKYRTAVATGILLSFLFIISGSAGAQELGVPKEPKLETAKEEPEMQWLWGEVVSVDNQKNVLLVKYLDYESDTEKEMAITVDNETTYENTKTLIDIRPSDIVSIDYVSRRDGSNIAKTIGVEKPETMENTEGYQSLPEEFSAAPENTKNSTAATTTPVPATNE